MEKLVSIDLYSDFGFLRKPDTNDGIAMSYNMLHKPAIIGIFGAILGLEGYQKRGELPQYYQVLHDLKIGIEPIGAEKGNFPKTTIVYTNTVGYANKDGNFIAYENTLIKPGYRVYVSLPSDHSLYDYLKNGKSEYIPYLGKNEFPIWWYKDSFKEYDKKPFDFHSEYVIKTLFTKKEGDVSRSQEVNMKSIGFGATLSKLIDSFFYFERLPIGFQEFNTKRGKEYQYEFDSFVYSNAKFSNDYRLNNLFVIEGSEVVQLN
jgi:CRISPR-associated protein Cas5h